MNAIDPLIDAVNAGGHRDAVHFECPAAGAVPAHLAGIAEAGRAFEDLLDRIAGGPRCAGDFHLAFELVAAGGIVVVDLDLATRRGGVVQAERLDSAAVAVSDIADLLQTVTRAVRRPAAANLGVTGRGERGESEREGC